MKHQPFLDSVILMSYKEIPLFDDLGIYLTDGPTVCRMDVADLEEVMAEVAFWVYNDLGEIEYYPPNLGHVWGEDKCADLWQVCYQYCTDMYAYEWSTYLVPTEKQKQLYTDWKKEFNVMPKDTFWDHSYPGGDEWVLSYLKSHRSGGEEDLYVPIIPMQDKSLLDHHNPMWANQSYLQGMHGPHSMAWVGFGEDVDFTPFKVDTAALRYNGVYRVISSSENTGKWDKNGLKRYVVKDSERITMFTTSSFRLETENGKSLAEHTTLQPPTS